MIAGSRRCRAEIWQTSKRATEQIYDVAIIGAGVVGCAVFRELVLAGLSCVHARARCGYSGGGEQGQ